MRLLNFVQVRRVHRYIIQPLSSPIQRHIWVKYYKLYVSLQVFWKSDSFVSVVFLQAQKKCREYFRTRFTTMSRETPGRFEKKTYLLQQYTKFSVGNTILVYTPRLCTYTYVKEGRSIPTEHLPNQTKLAQLNTF